jgi:hypothetical protein
MTTFEEPNLERNIEGFLNERQETLYDVGDSRLLHPTEIEIKGVAESDPRIRMLLSRAAELRLVIAFQPGQNIASKKDAPAYSIKGREEGRGKPWVEKFTTLHDAQQYIMDRWQGPDYMDGISGFHADYSTYKLSGFTLKDIGTLTYESEGGHTWREYKFTAISIATGEPPVTTVLNAEPTTVEIDEGKQFPALLVAIEGENVTDLIKIGDRVAIRWAGCLYGPSERIEDIANGELLDKIKGVLADVSTVWREVTMMDFGDGLGPVEIEPVVADDLPSGEKVGKAKAK